MIGASSSEIVNNAIKARVCACLDKFSGFHMDAIFGALVFTAEQMVSLEEAIEEAVHIDGDHHKQYALVRVAEMLGFELDSLDEDDRGIAP